MFILLVLAVATVLTCVVATLEEKAIAAGHDLSAEGAS